jgi:FkbM family methyltransferase
MINKIFIKFLSIIIELIDYPNKKKIIFFLKNELKNEKLSIIDIGSHKGETIDLFLKNFNVGEIFAFEPNIKLFKFLKKKHYDFKKIRLFNFGVGMNEGNLDLNIMIDSASSTFNSINLESNYYKRKKNIITFLSDKNNLLENKQQISIVTLSKFISDNKINKVDILKIDTEGFEFNILKGINSIDFEKFKYIYFEHHYDLMINKGYNFSDINNLLIKQNFKRKFKIKMKFRKSFEYIYENKILKKE